MLLNEIANQMDQVQTKALHAVKMVIDHLKTQQGGLVKQDLESWKHIAWLMSGEVINKSMVARSWAMMDTGSRDYGSDKSVVTDEEARQALAVVCGYKLLR